MGQVTKTSRREQVLLFGINYARGGAACERQLLGSTGALGGRGAGGRVQDWGWRPPHGTGTTTTRQDKAKAPHLRR